ncbi:inner membrane protein YpjD [candidate division KSB1 bacterium]
MQTLFIPLGFVIAGMYLIVSIMCLILFRSKNTDLNIPARSFAVVTILLHIVYIMYIVVTFHRLPLASVFEALSFTALVLTVTYIFIQYTSKENGTGFFIFPIIFVLQTVSAFNLKTIVPLSEINPVLASPYFAMHTVPSILGYASFLISMKYSLMYLLMHSQIKARHFGLLYEKIPNLDGLDKLNKKAIITGFTLLSIGILTGLLWAPSAWQIQDPNSPKVIASFILWLLYGTALVLRLFFGWQGKRSAIISLAGGVILMLSFFVI